MKNDVIKNNIFSNTSIDKDKWKKVYEQLTFDINDKNLKKDVVEDNLRSTERINNDIFELAKNELFNLSIFLNQESKSVISLRERFSNFFINIMKILLISLAVVFSLSFFFVINPIIYYVLSGTLITNVFSMLAIILKFGFTSYVESYYNSISKIFETLGTVNNEYEKNNKNYKE